MNKKIAILFVLIGIVLGIACYYGVNRWNERTNIKKAVIFAENLNAATDKAKYMVENIPALANAPAIEFSKSNAASYCQRLRDNAMGVAQMENAVSDAYYSGAISSVSYHTSMAQLEQEMDSLVSEWEARCSLLEAGE